MDSSNLTIQQARTLTESLRRPLNYLGKLRRRMELTGFPPNDPLYQATTRAFNAMQELHVRTHYLSCEGGVGRTPRQ